LLCSPVLAAVVDAPDLAFTELLQAPEGTKTDWPALRGKTVVVNFWATWCVPCVAEFPLLNALVASADPAKVQLIAADFNGEDRAKVDAFLKKHPLSGWVGIDTTKDNQRRFGVSAVPITFIIGPDGKVAHVTGHLETVSAAQLVALADGKPVTFDETVKADPALLADQKKQAAEAEKSKIESFKATDGKTLATAPGLRLAEALSAPDDGLPADLPRMAMWTPGRFEQINARLQDLVATAADVEATRVELSGVSSDKRYNLYVEREGADKMKLGRAIGTLISAALGVKIAPRTLTKTVLILAATSETSGHLDGPDPKPHNYCYFMPIPPDKGVVCLGGPVVDLADAIESALQTPTLLDKPIAGSVTATLPLPAPDLASVSDALKKSLGMTLTPAKRPVKMVVVTAK
jgi:thiol-disulfide isomerase/thioredoxin